MPGTTASRSNCQGSLRQTGPSIPRALSGSDIKMKAALPALPPGGAQHCPALVKLAGFSVAAAWIRSCPAYAKDFTTIRIQKFASSAPWIVLANVWTPKVGKITAQDLQKELKKSLFCILLGSRSWSRQSGRSPPRCCVEVNFNGAHRTLPVNLHTPFFPDAEAAADMMIIFFFGSLSCSLSLSLYLYVDVYLYLYTCIYTYVFMHIRSTIT